MSPKLLYEVLHDLDEIITAATDPKAVANIEDEGSRHSRSVCATDSPSQKKPKSRADKVGVRRVQMADSENPSQTHVT